MAAAAIKHFSFQQPTFPNIERQCTCTSAMEQERAGRRVREMWIYSSLDLLSQYLLLAISLYIHTRRRPKKKKKTVATWRRAAEKLIAFSLAKCPRWGGRGLAKNSLVHTISPKRDLRSFIISEKKRKEKKNCGRHRADQWLESWLTRCQRVVYRGFWPKLCPPSRESEIRHQMAETFVLNKNDDEITSLCAR